MNQTATLRYTLHPLLQHLIGVGTIGVLLAGTVYADDWPQFLGPHRNGTYAGDDLADGWPVEGPKELWSTTVGEGFAGPVVRGERLVIFHRQNDREVVDCLDARTGKNLWTFDAPTSFRDPLGYDDGPRSTPAIDEKHVYTLGAEGRLDCLDLASGKDRWSVDLHERFGVREGYFGAVSSPLVDGEQVLVHIGGRNNAGVGAFDRSTGKVLWTATHDEASGSSPTIATFGGARHALFFTRAGLVDADPANGDVRFQFPWRPPINASVNAAVPLVIENRIFLSTSYRRGAVLLEVKGNLAEPLWTSDDAMTNHYATCVYRDGYLYGFHGRQEYGPALRCVELQTGRVAWSKDRFGAGTLMLTGDRLVVLREDGQLLLLAASPEGYRELAAASILTGTVRAYPALAEGRLYARSNNKLVAVDLHK